MSTSTTAPARSNRYGGKCHKCTVWVEAGAGALVGSAGAGWRVEHLADACPAPKAKATPAAPPALGYYVTADGKAIKVVEAKRVQPDGSRRRYGLVFTPPAYAGKRPSWEYVRGAGYSVADLVPMTATDAAQIGLAHGHCIECCAPLGPKDPAKPSTSALVSALIGYGEKCAANNGWPYPKGVAAQRAYLAGSGS
jgi:hypothetical protein